MRRLVSMDELPNPALTIAAQCGAFDEREEAVESTIEALMVALPLNRNFAHTHIKVITISQLYSARVLSIDAALLARHISSISNLDDRLAAGDPGVVPLMYDCKTTRRKYYSFATKFCSWHNRLAYSLWDYNVDEALWRYKRQDGFAKFKRMELRIYPRLVEIVKEFRTFYGLDQSVKDIDKFLWQIGDDLLAKKIPQAPTS